MVKMGSKGSLRVFYTRRQQAVVDVVIVSGKQQEIPKSKRNMERGSACFLCYWPNLMSYDSIFMLLFFSHALLTYLWLELLCPNSQHCGTMVNGSKFSMACWNAIILNSNNFKGRLWQFGRG